MPFSLSGRTALVTGASSGLGSGFARLFAAAGANVILCARRTDRIDALARELGPNALAVAMDVTNEASVIAAFDAAEARFGTVNTIVCNAGTSAEGRSTDVPADGVLRLIETNLLGVHLVAREAGKRLIASGSRERGDGRIILIGSITAMQNWTGDAAYAATKAAVAHLGKQFAKEWVRQGINVNTVQPGWIRTEINESMFATEVGDRFVAALNRKRLQQAESLHDMMLYLASDRSAAVTGSIFTVDDGQSL